MLSSVYLSDIYAYLLAEKVVTAITDKPNLSSKIK